MPGFEWLGYRADRDIFGWDATLTMTGVESSVLDLKIKSPPSLKDAPRSSQEQGVWLKISDSWLTVVDKDALPGDAAAERREESEGSLADIVSLELLPR